MSGLSAARRAAGAGVMAVDAHREDTLGGLALVEADYEFMTRELMAVAAKYSDNRIVSMLEGGYNFSALGRSAVAHVRRLNAAL